jgi:AcrR family transcriptional regulator
MARSYSGAVGRGQRSVQRSLTMKQGVPFLKPKVGRPRQHGERRDTAETLKKSALDLLSRSGYRNVTIKDIGREAGVTTAMIYYHFRNKDELLQAAIEYAIETALTRFNDISRNIEHPG